MLRSPPNEHIIVGQKNNHSWTAICTVYDARIKYLVKKNSNTIVESNPINDYHRTLNLIIIGYHSII